MDPPKAGYIVVKNSNSGARVPVMEFKLCQVQVG